MDRSFVFVTGASQGFGRSVALEFVQFEPSADFLLVSRNAKNLEETKKLMEQKGSTGKIHIFAYDLGNLEKLEEYVTNMIAAVKRDFSMTISSLKNEQLFQQSKKENIKLMLENTNLKIQLTKSSQELEAKRNGKLIILPTFLRIL